MTAVAFLGAEPVKFKTSDMPAAIGILAEQGFRVNEDGRKHNLSMMCRQTESKLGSSMSNTQKRACILPPLQDADACDLRSAVVSSRHTTGC